VNTLVKRGLVEFDLGIRDWRPGHKWLHRSVLGIQAGSDFIVLYARAALAITAPLEPVKHFHLRTETIQAISEVIPLEDLFGQILIDVEQGQLEVQGTLYRLLRQHDNRIWHLSAHHSPFFNPSQSGGPRLPTLFVTSAQKHDVLQIAGGQQRLDWELKAADTPFASLDELARFLGFDPAADPRIELTALFPGAIAATSKISKGHAEIRANVGPALDRNAFKLGYVAYKAGAAPIRKHIASIDAKWVEHQQFAEAIFEFPIEDYQGVAVFLSYKGVAVHEAFIADRVNPANPRQLIYGLADEGLGFLRKYLLGEGKQADRDLEFAISCVLQLAGFSVLRLGNVEQLRDFADVIAYSITGKVLVAEVTIGGIDANDKLTKLAARSSQIADSLAEIGMAKTDVLPMIVTVLPRSVISGDLEKARKLGIAVVAREDLITVAAQPSYDLDSEKAFALFREQIPKNPSALS
jgi:hypothetical protein